MKKGILFFLLAILFSYSQSFAQSQDVTATGVAAVLQGDKAIARDTAINDALRKAVEQAVGTMVSSETVVENYQLIRDSILTKSQGYIQNYKVVSESPSPELYQVTISATVKLGDLKNDLGALGILMQRAQKPRVLFMIAEQNIGQEFYMFWWHGKSEFKGQHYDMAASETALKEEFLNKGFNVVDSSVATGKIEVSNAYRIADLTDAGAISVGRQMGAEVIVKGKALAKEGPRNTGSKVGSYIADITTSALRVDNGAVLGSARGHGVSRNISEVTGGTEALEKAAREASGKIIDQIVAKWSGEVSGGGLIQLTVRGISEYSDFVKFKDIIQGQIRGVQAIYQRSLEGGTAVLDVEMKGNAQQLSDEIAKKSFGGIPVKVIGASANTVEVSLGGASAPPSKVMAEPSPPPAAQTPPPAPTKTAVASMDDRHWIQSDDYFTSDRPYEHGWINVSLSKIKQPPTDKSKGEGQFFRLHDSKDIWTKYFWKTRLAEEADLQVGTLVICFEDNGHDDVYQAPEDKKSARTGRWFMGRVTDTSDLYKGAVQVDTYKCSPQALRIPIK
ncbi:MAG: flagellar assembly protein T N-terminal domain-containing protein [Nitrospinae bacterium]|nr:flagellar assembly protein T N-terminal domain-containing protein [Nitrospinota bacterium]